MMKNIKFLSVIPQLKLYYSTIYNMSIGKEQEDKHLECQMAGVNAEKMENDQDPAGLSSISICQKSQNGPCAWRKKW